MHERLFVLGTGTKSAEGASASVFVNVFYGGCGNSQAEGMHPDSLLKLLTAYL